MIKITVFIITFFCLIIFPLFRKPEASSLDAQTIPQSKPVLPFVPSPLNLSAAIRHYSLLAGEKPIIPEDFSLGPLQFAFPSDPQEKIILERVKEFFRLYTTGEDPKALYLPELQSYLSQVITPTPKLPDSMPLRLGKITHNETSAELRFSLPSPSGKMRTEGRLYLRKTNIWYIALLALEEERTENPTFSKFSISTTPTE